MSDKPKKEKKVREYQGVHDEIREQHMKTKDMSFKEKLSYFWYYYKVHTIVILVVAIFSANIIYEFATAKDYNFYAVMLNATHLSGEAMGESFGAYAGLDMENYDCYIDTLSSLSYRQQTEADLATFQKLIALVQTKDLDTMVLDGQVFYNFSLNGMLTDLREIYTEEELAKYEGKIYYLDYADVKAAEANEENEELQMEEYQKRVNATDEEINAEAQSHRNPDTMKEPIPVGIYLDESPFVEKTYAYYNSVPIYGFVITGQRTEVAKKYVDYLLDETIPFDEMIAAY